MTVGADARASWPACPVVDDEVRRPPMLKAHLQLAGDAIETCQVLRAETTMFVTGSAAVGAGAG
jgi:hypothetical protein